MLPGPFNEFAAKVKGITGCREDSGRGRLLGAVAMTRCGK